jgi:hypothetical protein
VREEIVTKLLLTLSEVVNQSWGDVGLELMGYQHRSRLATLTGFEFEPMAHYTKVLIIQ